MADSSMMIVLLALGAGAFYLMQSGKLGGMGGGGEETPAETPTDPKAPATPATPLPTQIPPPAQPLNLVNQPINIYNIHQRVARPPIPVVYNVTPYNRAIIIKQLSPGSIDLAYTRVAQYMLYFKSGRKGPVDHRWITFARDRARFAVHKSGHSKLHGRFADKVLEVAYRIQYAPTSRDIEIISRDAASIFINLEQADPQLLIRVS